MTIQTCPATHTHTATFSELHREDRPQMYHGCFFHSLRHSTCTAQRPLSAFLSFFYPSQMRLHPLCPCPDPSSAQHHLEPSNCSIFYFCSSQFCPPRSTVLRVQKRFVQLLEVNQPSAIHFVFLKVIL